MKTGSSSQLTQSLNTVVVYYFYFLFSIERILFLNSSSKDGYQFKSRVTFELLINNQFFSVKECQIKRV